MNFKESIDWLYGFEKFGVKLGLERITNLCKELRNPQENYQIIHVGGTNGKGSVCRYISSVLTFSGFKTGIYTSPHLQRFQERFIIDDQEISEQDVAYLVEKIKPIVEKMKDLPTFFEIVTAMCFQYFKEKKVDYAVLEVGLGGRYDATNIVKPIQTAITNVSLEHQKTLGKTIDIIAIEKAGIIKNDIPIVTAAQKESLDVIKKIADVKNANITVVDNSKWIRNTSQGFLIKGELNDYNVKTKMIGEFQGENIALALGVIEGLQVQGVYITDESITRGIEKTICSGRMEIINQNPLILLDGAHNPAGMNILKSVLETDFEYNNLVLILGILSDKNISKMLKIIVPLANMIILTKSNNSRACNPQELEKQVNGLKLKGKTIITTNVKDAIDHAQKIAGKDDLICITGSLFTVGEARDIFGL